MHQGISIFILLSILTFSNCSKDDVKKEDPDPIVLDISIDELTSNYFYTGDILTITGNNFINKNYPTKIIIKSKSYDIIPISNTKIEFEITSEIAIEKNTLQVEIYNRRSEEKSFFLLPRDWYKIPNNGGNVRKVYLHENNAKITALNINSSQQAGRAFQYELDGNGYSYIQNSFTASIYDLMMYDENYGVSCSYSSFYTTDGFQTNNKQEDLFQEYGGVNPFLYADKVLKVDKNGYIITNGFGTHARSVDQGVTVDVSPTPFESNNSAQIYKIGKGSNGKYYEFGLFATFGSTAVTTKLVMSSDNGFDNWNVIHNTLPFTSEMKHVIFYDYDLLYSINKMNELVKSTDLARTWEFVEPNIDAFFIKSKSEWYKVSDFKLYHTENAGNTWKFELNLPDESEAYDMDFNNENTAISGSNFIYIKHS